MDKKQISVNLSWLATEERAPSQEILSQMFGMDDRIGDYAEEEKKASLQNCHNLQEAIDIVICYAENVHGQQQAYETVSPLGGLDISVVGIDEIAFGQLGDLAPFADPDQDVVLELAKALKRAGYPLGLFERQTRAYETLQLLPDFLQEQFGNVQELKRELEQMEQEQRDFSSQYLDPIKERLSDLREEELQIERYSPLRKIWNKGRIQKLEQEREGLELKKGFLQERLDGMQKAIEEKDGELFEATYELENVHYPEDKMLESPYVIQTKEDLENLVQEIRSYCEEPDIQEAYHCAARILGAVRQPEVPSFAEERERRKQASFPEKENRQGISSELERDKDDFTRSR